VWGAMAEEEKEQSLSGKGIPRKGWEPLPWELPRTETPWVVTGCLWQGRLGLSGCWRKKILLPRWGKSPGFFVLLLHLTLFLLVSEVLLVQM